MGKWADLGKDEGGNRIRGKRGDLFAEASFDWNLKLVLVYKILRLKDNIHWIIVTHSLISSLVTPGLFSH